MQNTLDMSDEVTFAKWCEKVDECLAARGLRLAEDHELVSADAFAFDCEIDGQPDLTILRVVSA